MQQQFAARIVVDDRERFAGVTEALWSRPGISVAVRRLQLGDYQVADSLVVERKTLADFALSVRDGRLFSQVSRLARSTRERPRIGATDHNLTTSILFSLTIVRL